MIPSSLPLRLLLAFVLVLAALLLAFLLLVFSDTALSVWQRLERLPAAWRFGYLVGLCLIGAGTGYGVWRLLRRRPAARGKAPAEAPRRDRVEARLRTLTEAGVEATAAAGELVELDRRREQGRPYLAVFGTVSAGKSRLLAALGAMPPPSSDVRAGTTRAVAHFQLELKGRAMIGADVPGIRDPDRPELAAEAEAEALRAHVVLFVAEGDLTRVETTALERLLSYGKPLLLVLNKSDRLSAEERGQLQEHLRRRWQPRGVEVVSASAGGRESVLVREGEQEHWQERERPPELTALEAALARLLAGDFEALERRRESSLVGRVSETLDQVQGAHRSAEAERLVQRYSRRAVVGAMAAVAPGSDLVIQGALATALVRSLCRLYEVPVRQVDIDRFLSRAGGAVRTTTSIALAIAGNAMKAFPGVGTLTGGLVHAVAYGLIFDALGRALARSLAEGEALASAASLERLREELAQPIAARAAELGRLALKRGLSTSSEPDAD